MLKNLHDCIDNMVLEVSKEIENINYGGCGWFAYYVCQEFRRAGIDYKIINYNTTEEMKDNLDFLHENKYVPINKIGVHHLLVRIGNCIFDGKEVYTRPPKYWHYKGVKHHIGVLNASDIYKLLQNDAWLSVYDVSQNKKLLRIIRKHIEIYGQKESNNSENSEGKNYEEKGKS